MLLVICAKITVFTYNQANRTLVVVCHPRGTKIIGFIVLNPVQKVPLRIVFTSNAYLL